MPWPENGVSVVPLQSRRTASLARQLLPLICTPCCSMSLSRPRSSVCRSIDTRAQPGLCSHSTPASSNWNGGICVMAEQRQRVLVTGGAGFVGSAILAALREKHPSWRLFSFDLVRPPAPIDGVSYLSGDAKSAGEVRSAMRSAAPTVVIHSAGLVPPLGHRYTRKLQKVVYENNINGTATILEQARVAGVRAFVWTSSCCAVTDDMRYPYPNIDETWKTSSSNSLVYGESKARAERLVLAANNRRSGFLACSIRPSVVFGPEDYQLIPSIHACIAKHETPFVLGDATNLWDCMHVDNVAVAHVLAVENLLGPGTAAGEAFFISNNEPIPFRDFCREIWKHFGHYPPFELQIPGRVATGVAAVADVLFTTLGLPVTLSAGSVGDAMAVRYCSGEKARDVLGYEPKIGLEDGIRESCEALKKRLARERSTYAANEKPVPGRAIDHTA